MVTIPATETLFGAILVAEERRLSFGGGDRSFEAGTSFGKSLVVLVYSVCTSPIKVS